MAKKAQRITLYKRIWCKVRYWQALKEISDAELARKGINVSVQKHYESFLRSLCECQNKKFIMIPKHAGGVTLQNGVTTYVSAESVIQGLEDPFSTEVREHTMVVHPLSLKDMSTIYSITIFDILQYIVQYNEEGEPYLDEAHQKLRCKLQAVHDELEDTPQNKNSWGEFLKEQGKPIVVISTGADSVGKGSEIIDVMLESLYSYKQCYPDSRYTVVIDEAQDLYLHEKGAVNTLLRKGGKHGVAMLMASQSFPDPTTQFGKVVGNCGRVRGYRSKENDLARYAERFGCYKDEADSLQKGNCFDNGQFWSRYRRGNVIKTLKGKTVAFETVPDNNNDNFMY